MTSLWSRSVLALMTAPAVLGASPPSTVPPPTVLLPPPPPSVIPTVNPHVAPKLTESQQKQLRKMLADADASGIAPSGSTALPNGSDDAALVQAALDFAQALHHGRLAPSAYMKDWGLRPAPYDPWPDFIAAVQKDQLARWISSLPPPYTGYDALKEGLATYREIDAKGGWSVIPEGPDIGPGTATDRIAALRERLAIEDKALSRSPSRYDQDMIDAVRKAQRRYGLEPTGIAGKATIAALNVSAHDRVRQIEANMERWRWLPAELPTNRIQVNIAAAVLTVFKADDPVTSMRAVTGRPGDETPMLTSQVHSVVFNPPWNVPTSIATKELWPKEKAHRGYLKAHGYRVIDLPGGGNRLQQAAGSKSALGRVKFDFDNPYGVYLHDTPSQGTFNKYSRLASHGCVRLARPVDLAKLVLTGDPVWTPDAVDAALAKGDTVRAKLPEPIAVFLLYWTAYGSADGTVNFREDPYGWDTELANRIEASANAAHQMVAVR